MPRPRRTQQERVEESTARLFRAAVELIAEGGYEAATAAEIGRRAGYSRSMVRARFGSKEQLIDAVLRSAYEAPLTRSPDDDASGLERVLARLDTVAALVEDDPALMRTIFSVEFVAAGRGSALTDRVAAWVAGLRADVLAAVLDGQADGSVRPELDAETTAHAIVAEGIGSAFMWTVNPDEDFRARIPQWRERTRAALEA
ncbi:TetR/AcrR family transcriptional regulator [Conexibacter sp. SYSU D00693]|uniref:TetR/AcrR family transcriptional regulator n=1 Tax=Conexibacter sp. SYSU D00693 TaxID=2812560 RepID=UPI00196A4611|nr:TetR/AcrR family transcriptional regulator [Conexibacter sp. SYSU D00693]